MVVAGAFGEPIRGWGFGGVGGLGVMRVGGVGHGRGVCWMRGEMCRGAPRFSFYCVLGWLQFAFCCWGVAPGAGHGVFFV